MATAGAGFRNPDRAPGGGVLLWALLLALLLPWLTPTPAAAEDALYRVTTLRAAPGAFDALLDRVKAMRAEAPLHILRHSQGDQWDVMTIEPVGDYAGYFADSARLARDAARRDEIDRLAAFREEWFVRGADAGALAGAFAATGLYHVEMFRALAGKKAELLAQRQMENRYLDAVGLVSNSIFIGDQGSDYDIMTIGFHADLPAFAAPGTADAASRDTAAREAGFASAAAIGPYLRSLILSHNDTLAVRVE